MNKKLLLSLGSTIAIASPIATVIACGSDNSNQYPLVKISWTMQGIKDRLEQIKLKNPEAPQRYNQKGLDLKTVADWKPKLEIKTTGFLYANMQTSNPIYWNSIYWFPNQEAFDKEFPKGTSSERDKYAKIDVNHVPVLMYQDVTLSYGLVSSSRKNGKHKINISDYARTKNGKNLTPNKFNQPAKLIRNLASLKVIDNIEYVIQNSVHHTNILKSLQPKFKFLQEQAVQTILDPENNPG